MTSNATDPLYAQAIQQFHEWFAEAKALDVNEPDAMVLATCSADGHPTARVLLLRGVDERGFVFFTNAESNKGEQLTANARAALCLYWDALGKQVRVEGSVVKVDEAESDAYWQQRHKRSRIASLASLQSRRLPDRVTYEQRVADLEREYADRDVPRPTHWHGFRVVPRRIEFWINKLNRMHDRQVYELAGESWEHFLLYP